MVVMTPDNNFFEKSLDAPLCVDLPSISWIWLMLREMTDQGETSPMMGSAVRKVVEKWTIEDRGVGD